MLLINAAKNAVSWIMYFHWNKERICMWERYLERERENEK